MKEVTVQEFFGDKLLALKMGDWTLYADGTITRGQVVQPPREKVGKLMVDEERKRITVYDNTGHPLVTEIHDACVPVLREGAVLREGNDEIKTAIAAIDSLRDLLAAEKALVLVAAERARKAEERAETAEAALKSTEQRLAIYEVDGKPLGTADSDVNVVRHPGFGAGGRSDSDSGASAGIAGGSPGSVQLADAMPEVDDGAGTPQP